MEEQAFGFWEFLAGLGIFLFGMYQLENGLSGLAGNSMKKVLKRITKKTWKGILTGASITALLQSSSLVTLLVAAFLGAGLLNFQSAFGVVIGANLGTTATAWIVAVLGFKVDIAHLSYPFLAIGTLSYLMLDGRPILKNMGRFLVGFGLIFLGLDHMKEAIDAYASSVDLGQFKDYGYWIFLLLGLIITGLIQSSSAMIVIVLSTLNSGIIDIYQASSIVIGSNIGTTSTLFLASVNGSHDKKRLALGNVFFNILAATFAFILLKPMVSFIKYPLNISDSVIQLAAFNTLFNLGGLLLIYPFIRSFIRALKKIYVSKVPKKVCQHLNVEVALVPELAVKAMHQELLILFEKTKSYILQTLGHKDSNSTKHPTFLSNVMKKEDNPFYDYEQLKKIEDEISAFFSRLSSLVLTEKEAFQITVYMDQLRSMVYAAKTIKDIHFNIQDLEASSDKETQELLYNIQKFTALKLSEYNNYLQSQEAHNLKIVWKHAIDKFYRENIEYIFKEISTKNKHGLPISTLTNVVKKATTTLDELSNALPLENQWDNNNSNPISNITPVLPIDQKEIKPTKPIPPPEA